MRPHPKRRQSKLVINPDGSRRHIPPSEHAKIVEEYTINLTPMADIANDYGVSRQGIYKILKKLGINTSKQTERTQITVSCDYCQAQLIRNRAKVRNQIRHFCDFEHYYKFIDINQGVGAYKQNRHGQRIARAKVSYVFDLQLEHVVHHKDRNCFNNRWDNLAVFANNGDHIRFHRLGPDYISPIWEGNMDMPEYTVGHYTENYID
jgi:predicted DNA-binding protein YlxM (UPF0122 family)